MTSSWYWATPQTPSTNTTSPTATIILRVQYPPAYPDMAPDLDLSFPPNAPKYANLDIQSDKPALLSALTPTIEENMGMAMVFTLVSTLKECAEALIQERLDAAQAVKEVIAAKAEEEENRKFQGEAVTRESFLNWRKGFAKEMEEEERAKVEEREAEDKKKRVGREEKKLTGRELWEKGLAGKAGEEDEDVEGDGEELVEDMEKVKVSS